MSCSVGKEWTCCNTWHHTSASFMFIIIIIITCWKFYTEYIKVSNFLFFVDSQLLSFIYFLWIACTSAMKNKSLAPQCFLWRLDTLVRPDSIMMASSSKQPSLLRLGFFFPAHTAYFGQINTAVWVESSGPRFPPKTGKTSMRVRRRRCSVPCAVWKQTWFSIHIVKRVEITQHALRRTGDKTTIHEKVSCWEKL